MVVGDVLHVYKRTKKFMNRLFGLQLILQSDLPNTTKLGNHEWNFQMLISITACMR